MRDNYFIIEGHRQLWLTLCLLQFHCPKSSSWFASILLILLLINHEHLGRCSTINILEMTSSGEEEQYKVSFNWSLCLPSCLGQMKFYGLGSKWFREEGFLSLNQGVVLLLRTNLAFVLVCSHDQIWWWSVWRSLQQMWSNIFSTHLLDSASCRVLIFQPGCGFEI